MPYLQKSCADHLWKYNSECRLNVEESVSHYLRVKQQNQVHFSSLCCVMWAKQDIIISNQIDSIV